MTAATNFQVPAMASLNETDNIRIVLFGTGGSLANIEFWIIHPNGNAVEYVSSFRDVSSYISFTFISLFDMSFTFQQPGLYTFLLWDKSSGDVLSDSTYVAEWATRIDIPVSDLKKQRTDIERVYSKLNRG